MKFGTVQITLYLGRKWICIRTSCINYPIWVKFSATDLRYVSWKRRREGRAFVVYVREVSLTRIPWNL